MGAQKTLPLAGFADYERKWKIDPAEDNPHLHFPAMSKSSKEVREAEELANIPPLKGSFTGKRDQALDGVTVRGKIGKRPVDFTLLPGKYYQQVKNLKGKDYEGLVCL
jgi:hypothetical protein